MNIEVSYEFPHTSWNVARVFDNVAKTLEKKYNNVERKDSAPRTDGNPGNFYSPHMLTLKNIETDEYIVVSYWDRAFELFYESCGWNPKKCKAIYTSSGVRSSDYITAEKYNIPIIPISYCQYRFEYDTFSSNSLPVIQKPDSKLFFRGFLYGQRLQLSEILKENITNIKIDQFQYYFELQRNKINLSLNGAAEICNRDLEILGSRSVLLRPTLKQNFKNPLKEGVHYIGFPHNPNPDEQAKIIVDTYNSIKDNEPLLTQISEAGYKWFLENGTVEKNADIILEQLNLDLIK